MMLRKRSGIQFDFQEAFEEVDLSRFIAMYGMYLAHTLTCNAHAATIH